MDRDYVLREIDKISDFLTSLVQKLLSISDLTDQEVKAIFRQDDVLFGDYNLNELLEIENFKEVVEDLNINQFKLLSEILNILYLKESKAYKEIDMKLLIVLTLILQKGKDYDLEIINKVSEIEERLTNQF